VKKEPAWLTAAIDQRLALMVEVMGPSTFPLAKNYGVMLTPLTEPEEDATQAEMDRWDRTCDNCGKDCTGLEFFAGSAMRSAFGTNVCFTFGVCAECVKKE
jgi:hypothetical protein